MAIASGVSRLAIAFAVLVGVSAWALTAAKSSLPLTIGFESGSTNLSSNAREAVGRVIDRIRAEDWCTFEVAIVVGHADATEGSAAAVQALSVARAETVADVLRKQGIPPTMILVEGQGSSRPAEGRPSARVELEAVGGAKSKDCPYPIGPAGLRVSI